MPSLASGQLIAARYRLEKELARGGMGSVWVARHVQLDTQVAVKFMAPEYSASAEARERFAREAKACAQIKMPNVVQVHDYGIEDDAPYLVMELLQGEDLSARLAREGRLSLPATRLIVDQVCKALHRSHALGLIHRDLKPGNLFLAREGDDEIVKVLDFGIAKATGTTLVGNATKTGTLIGSPHYMSPEQMRRSNQVDARSDLWALGVIVFRCVAGQLPFAGEELVDLLVQICSDPIPRASAVAPDIGPELDAFLDRALRRPPEERFQTAREFAEAFSAVVTASQARSVDPAAVARAPIPPLVSSPVGGAAPPPGASAYAPAAVALPYAPASGHAAGPAWAPSIPTVPHVAPPPALGEGAHPPSAVMSRTTASVLLTPAPSSGSRVGVWIALGGGALLTVAVAGVTLARRSPSPSTSADAPAGVAPGLSASAAPSAVPQPPPAATTTPAPAVSPAATETPGIPSAKAPGAPLTPAPTLPRGKTPLPKRKLYTPD